MDAPMNDVWSDIDDSSMPSPRSSALSFDAPSTGPPSTLTQRQNSLVSIYSLHSSHVIDLMNIIVDLEIAVRRERDEPGLQCLRDELAKAQVDLAMHREGKRKKERQIGKEEERLKKVLGDGKAEDRRVARSQLDEIVYYMGSGRASGCLR
ncbi:hypothetical protein TW65_04343 [Stemphylium lycopersici]|nr:hypothetical protein TW65_04343 [Stemphylium lycopersici]